MSDIVLSDITIQDKTDYYRSLLLVSPYAVLRLFQNNFTPTPANVLSDFVEATFQGYASINLMGHLGAKSQIQAGEWHFFSDVFTYSAPLSGSPQTIYGWYVQYPRLDGTHLFGSARFDAPVVMQVGGLPFSLQIEFMDSAGSLVPWP